MKKILLVAFLVVAVISIIFYIGTRPTSVNVNPGIVFNYDEANPKQRPFAVDQKEYPFQSHWYERDGVSMHYIDEGQGTPIVLTHGNPDWSFLNRNIIKALSGEARIIAYDLPGFGFSDTPEGYEFTPQEHAEWIQSLIFDHLKLKKFIIVVQDWGGATGLEVATTHPDNIYGLVISNTWGWKVEGGLLKLVSDVTKTSAVQRLFKNTNFFIDTIMISSFQHEESRNNPSITDAYRMAAPSPESRRGIAKFPTLITDAGEWLSELEERLFVLSGKPVELIFGMKDTAIANPEIISRWERHFPNANLVKLPDAGHYTQEDSPESFVYALRRILKKIESENIK
jgi:haloalkane dehalogenase